MDKVYLDRIFEFIKKPIKNLNFLESLVYKAYHTVNSKNEYRNVRDTLKQGVVLGKLLIDAEIEEKDRLETVEMTYGNVKADIYFPMLLDFYKEFDKKLNAAIEEVLNAKN